MGTKQCKQINTNHNCFEHFIGNRRQNPLVVVLTQSGVKSGQLFRYGSEQHSKRDLNVLEVCNTWHTQSWHQLSHNLTIAEALVAYNTFTAGNDGHIARSGSDVVDDSPLNPWYEKVCALSHHIGLNAGEPVENDRSRAPVHCNHKPTQLVTK